MRGAAPGTRETDLLRPGNLVERAHAVVLSGGSAYVPNLAGKSLAEARELLASANLTLNPQIQAVDSK